MSERPSERVIELRTRTLLRVLFVVLGIAIGLLVVWASRGVLAWILIAVFFALALDPLVSWVETRLRLSRGPAIGVAYLVVALAIVAIGATFVPKLVSEVNGFVEAVPDYVEDLTEGRGRLGFLERDYQVVERLREFVEEGGASRVLGLSGAAVSITKGVLTLILAIVSIIFLTFFMLLEGRAWVERFYQLLPERSQPRWRRVGTDVYRTVGGYVSGNLLISLIAGITCTVVLLVMGVEYAVALGLVVAILDLIPLAGATLAGIIVVTVAFLHSTAAGIVLLIFMIVYQQFENHVLQPVVYGRTVQLSPLVVLVAILIGAELAGILGALAAIPVAGSIQVILREVLAARREREEAATATPAPPPGGA